MLKRLTVAAAAAAAVLATYAPARAAVHTTGGLIAGVATASALEFLGIPYASPPVGALRWAPPHPTSWSGTLEANALPPPCPQNASPFGVASTSEDCLYLNIYAPLTGAKNLPVMFWIHGGADDEGTGDQYDGSALVQNGVIVVTINYRLGLLGFLAHPALDAASPGHASGDYGLMDQQAALRWVKSNIASFGGNPDNVTVFGESAGGQNILDHLASPGATGLFQRAIIQSGAYAVQLPSLSSAESRGVSFANSVGCSSATDPSCLRALSVHTLLASEAAIGGSTSNLTGFEPNVGTTTLPVQPLLAIAFGVINRVPVLQGSNHDEARLFTLLDDDANGAPLSRAGYGGAISALVGAKLSPLIALIYPLGGYSSPDLAYSTLFTDAAFACSARGFDQLLSSSVPVYNYEFADEDAASLLYDADPFMPLGAPHTSELPFLWPDLVGQSGVASGALMTSSEMALAVQMRLAWTNFARSGNPNGLGVASWPAYNAKTDQFHEFGPPSAGTNAGFANDHKCQFWTPLLTLEGLVPPGYSSRSPG